MCKSRLVLVTSGLVPRSKNAARHDKDDDADDDDVRRRHDEINAVRRMKARSSSST